MLVVLLELVDVVVGVELVVDVVEVVELVVGCAFEEVVATDDVVSLPEEEPSRL